MRPLLWLLVFASLISSSNALQIELTVNSAWPSAERIKIRATVQNGASQDLGQATFTGSGNPTVILNSGSQLPPSTNPRDITKILFFFTAGRTTDGPRVIIDSTIQLLTPGVGQGRIPFTCYTWAGGSLNSGLLPNAYLQDVATGRDTYPECYPYVTGTESLTQSLTKSFTVGSLTETLSVSKSLTKSSTETLTVSKSLTKSSTETLTVPLDYALPEFAVDEGSALEGSQSEPAVASFADGGVVVCWTSQNRELVRRYEFNIFCLMFDVTGAEQGSKFQINSNNLGTQQSPSVAVLQGNSIVVVWNSDHLLGHNVISRQFDNGVANAEGEVIHSAHLASGKKTLPDVASIPSTNYFVICWQSFGSDGSYFGVYAVRHSVGESSVPFLVNTATQWDQTDAKVACFTDGGYVITWGSYTTGTASDIFMKRYNALDVAQTPSDEKVNSDDANTERAPAIARFSDNTFMIVWVRITTTDSTLWAATFDATGSRVVTEFRVDTDVGLRVRNCDIVTLNDDTVLITWGASNAAGTSFGTYARRFTRIVSVLPAEYQNQFLINENTAGEKLKPKVEKFGPWGFFITWQTTDPNSESDITGKWYPEYKPILF